MVAKKVTTNMISLHVFEDKALKSKFSAWQSFNTLSCIYHEMEKQNKFLQFWTTHIFMFTIICYPVTLFVQMWWFQYLLMCSHCISCQWIHFKSALLDLRQFLSTENPLKITKNAFYFTLKVIFLHKIFRFFSWIFGHVEKQLC